MPLLVGVRAGSSRTSKHGRIPSHVDEAVKMILGAIGVKGRHFRREIFDCYDGSHFISHVVL